MKSFARAMHFPPIVKYIDTCVRHTFLISWHGFGNDVPKHVDAHMWGYASEQTWRGCTRSSNLGCIGCVCTGQWVINGWWMVTCCERSQCVSHVWVIEWGRGAALGCTKCMGYRFVECLYELYRKTTPPRVTKFVAFSRKWNFCWDTPLTYIHSTTVPCRWNFCLTAFPAGIQ